MRLTGLTLGTNNTLQVRAIGGPTDYSGWTDPCRACLCRAFPDSGPMPRDAMRHGRRDHSLGVRLSGSESRSLWLPSTRTATRPSSSTRVMTPRSDPVPRREQRAAAEPLDDGDHRLAVEHAGDGGGNLFLAHGRELAKNGKSDLAPHLRERVAVEKQERCLAVKAFSLARSWLGMWGRRRGASTRAFSPPPLCVSLRLCVRHLCVRRGFYLTQRRKDRKGWFQLAERKCVLAGPVRLSLRAMGRLP